MTESVFTEPITKTVFDADPGPDSDGGLSVSLLDEVELEYRQVAARQCWLVGRLDDAGHFGGVEQTSLFGLLSSRLQWSPAQYRQRIPIARCGYRYQIILERLAAGRLPVGHAEVLCRHILNSDVTERPNFEGELTFWLGRAETWEYVQFRDKLAEWVKIVEPDVAAGLAERQRARRSARMFQRCDGMFELHARFDPLSGAVFQQRWAQQIDTEFNRDWQQTHPNGDDDVGRVGLARTDAQRCCDALVNLATRDPDAATQGDGVMIVVDQHTFEDEISRLANNNHRLVADIVPDDFYPPTARSGLPVEQRHCRTSDGTAIDPATAVTAALRGAVRYVMVDQLNRPLATSSKQRNFTGVMRQALKAISPRCIWPGCNQRSGRCQTDHHQNVSQGGTTTYDNATGLLCPTHNRHKHQHHLTITHHPNHTITIKPAPTKTGKVP